MGIIDLIKGYRTVKARARINDGEFHVEIDRRNSDYNDLSDSLQIALEQCSRIIAQHYSNANIELKTEMRIKIR